MVIQGIRSAADTVEAGLAGDLENQLQAFELSELQQVSKDSGALAAFLKAGQERAGGKKKKGMGPEITARVLARSETDGQRQDKTTLPLESESPSKAALDYLNSIKGEYTEEKWAGAREKGDALLFQTGGAERALQELNAAASAVIGTQITLDKVKRVEDLLDPDRAATLKVDASTG